MGTLPSEESRPPILSDTLRGPRPPLPVLALSPQERLITISSPPFRVRLLLFFCDNFVDLLVADTGHSLAIWFRVRLFPRWPLFPLLVVMEQRRIQTCPRFRRGVQPGAIPRSSASYDKLSLFLSDGLIVSFFLIRLCHGIFHVSRDLPLSLIFSSFLSLVLF